MEHGMKVMKGSMGKAIVTASYLINRCSSSAIDFKIPIEGKLEPREKKCIIIGYAKGVKGYKLWSIEPGDHQKYFVSGDVVFKENKMYKDTLESHAKSKSKNVEGVQFEVVPPERTDHIIHVAIEETVDKGEQEVVNSESEPDEDNHMDYELVRDRKRREFKPPLRYGFVDVVHYALNIAELGGL
uniref:Retroviral polymerase SH3-like domain-containing protein n=1 Tax=Cannabis sativa TaxID=3483 RepID=A0A803PV82_CANSA